MAPSLQQFTLFRNLPKEIRLKIWRLCLPCRVIEVGYLSEQVDWENPEHSQFCCYKEDATDRNCLPPLLLQVCYESRQLALKSGHADIFDIVDKWATWRQPSRDKVLLWHYTTWYFFKSEVEQRWHELFSDGLREFFDWARRANMTPCVYHFLIHPFVPVSSRTEYPELGSPQVSALAVLANLAKNSRLQVSLKTIILHITKQDAKDSGMFGIFGENPVQLVDVNDYKAFLEYYELWSRCSMDKSPAVTQAFDAIMAKDKFQADVARWIEKAKFVLLAAIWNAARSGGSSDIEYSERIWSPRVAPNQFPDMNMHTIDDNHPWVVRTRAELPDLLPKVNFRCCSSEWCLIECGAITDPGDSDSEGASSPDPAPLDNPFRLGSRKWNVRRIQLLH